MTKKIEVPSIDFSSTFDTFFSPSEKVVDGTVVRVVKGELTTVTVDAEARQAAEAARQAETDARNAKTEAYHAAEAWYYSEE